MQKSKVQHQQITAVIAAQFFEIAGIGNIGDSVFFSLENQTVVLHHVHVAYRSGERNITDGIGFACFQIFDAFQTFSEVTMQD